MSSVNVGHAALFYGVLAMHSKQIVQIQVKLSKPKLFWLMHWVLLVLAADAVSKKLIRSSIKTKLVSVHDKEKHHRKLNVHAW